jgi:hypothetical protein
MVDGGLIDWLADVSLRTCSICFLVMGKDGRCF